MSGKTSKKIRKIISFYEDPEAIKKWKSWSDIPTKEVRKLVAIMHK